LPSPINVPFDKRNVSLLIAALIAAWIVGASPDPSGLMS